MATDSSKIDQLTKDLANAQAELARMHKNYIRAVNGRKEFRNSFREAQAEIARLREALLEAKQLIMDINGKTYEFIEQALSQSSPSLQEYRDMKQIAHLIGSIFFAGNFIAETANERELETLLIKNGFRYKSWDEITEMEGKSC
jgi:chromosome segregation ATPase